MGISPQKREKLYRGARVASYGAAGNLAGTLVGVSLGVNNKLTAGMGAGIGLAIGGGMETNRNARLIKSLETQGYQVKRVKASTGTGEFQRRVGSKTNARVGRRDHPYK